MSKILAFNPDERSGKGLGVIVNLRICETGGHPSGVEVWRLGMGGSWILVDDSLGVAKGVNERLERKRPNEDGVMGRSVDSIG
jgi:hypothetical protein